MHGCVEIERRMQQRRLRTCSTTFIFSQDTAVNTCFKGGLLSATLVVFLGKKHSRDGEKTKKGSKSPPPPAMYIFSEILGVGLSPPINLGYMDVCGLRMSLVVF